MSQLNKSLESTVVTVQFAANPREEGEFGDGISARSVDGYRMPPVDIMHGDLESVWKINTGGAVECDASGKVLLGSRNPFRFQ